jgi:GAF domain-containing protein
MTVTAPRRPAGGPDRPLTLISAKVRRSFAALSREEAQAVLQERPDPVAAIRRPGPDPYSVLLFGAGVLRGVGLRDHELGLPGRIADELAARRRRGVHLDVVVEPQPTAPKALNGLAGLRIRRYDAVIVMLGEHDTANLVAAQWRGALVGLTKLLVTDTCPAAGLFLYDSSRAVAPVTAEPPTARAVAGTDRLVTVSEDVCALARRVRFAEIPAAVLPADPTRGFEDGTYRDWAAWMVDRLEPALADLERSTDEDLPKRYRNRQQDERLRQRAVASLRLRPGTRTDHLDQEVREAKAMYRAAAAALTVLDGDIAWTRATTEADVRIIERSQAFCDLGIRSDGPLVINDALVDPRTRDNPLAQNPGGIRFYAGWPVHTWDGYRIGMLCVYGPTPRSFRARDLDGLRDTAARIEELLWRDALQGVRVH